MNEHESVAHAAAPSPSPAPEAPPAVLFEGDQAPQEIRNLPGVFVVKPPRPDLDYGEISVGVETELFRVVDTRPSTSSAPAAVETPAAPREPFVRCAGCETHLPARLALRHADPKRSIMSHDGTLFDAERIRYACDEECLRDADEQEALDRLYAERAPDPIADAFHKHFYEAARGGGSWLDTRYAGVPVLKNPLDLWVLQETLHEVRPGLVIETGTYCGGSAAFVHDVMPFGGKVVTIDLEDRRTHGHFGRSGIHYLLGSSTDPRIVKEVRDHLRGTAVLVLLDSDHRKEHVLRELEIYAPMVTVGSYVCVEDVNLPLVLPDSPLAREGPAQAVEEFLASEAGRGFVRDRSKEKYLVTFNAWLKRVSS